LSGTAIRAATRAAIAAAAAASIVAAGCAPPAGQNSTRGPTTRAEVPTVFGDWIIVGHRIPGTSALNDDDARQWHGRVFHYAAGVASSIADTCASPSYRRRIVPADSLLGVGFHTTLEALEWPDTVGQKFAITEVTCGGESWSAPGAVLIWVTPDKPFTPWDGVFFQLERDTTAEIP
jgi:hypothetical protein